MIPILCMLTAVYAFLGAITLVMVEEAYEPRRWVLTLAALLWPVTIVVLLAAIFGTLVWDAWREAGKR